MTIKEIVKRWSYSYFDPTPRGGDSMTFRTLTKQIAQLEGKKKQVDIAQISEITKTTLTILANIELSEVEKLLEKYKFGRRVR